MKTTLIIFILFLLDFIQGTRNKRDLERRVTWRIDDAKFGLLCGAQNDSNVVSFMNPVVVDFIEKNYNKEHFRYNVSEKNITESPASRGVSDEMVNKSDGLPYNNGTWCDCNKMVFRSFEVQNLTGQFERIPYISDKDYNMNHFFSFSYNYLLNGSSFSNKEEAYLCRDDEWRCPCREIKCLCVQEFLNRTYDFIVIINGLIISFTIFSSQTLIIMSCMYLSESSCLPNVCTERRRAVCVYALIPMSVVGIAAAVIFFVSSDNFTEILTMTWCDVPYSDCNFITEIYEYYDDD